MLKGRLGLDSAKVRYADRAGCVYLARGALSARDGTLSFHQVTATESDALAPGKYAIPLQGVSIILLGPGSTVTHDALRLLAYARTALAAVGEDGVRFYTGLPRTRGDMSRVGVYSSPGKEASPHTRGYVPPCFTLRPIQSGFPAHAGICPTKTQ